MGVIAWLGVALVVALLAGLILGALLSTVDLEDE